MAKNKQPKGQRRHGVFDVPEDALHTDLATRYRGIGYLEDYYGETPSSADGNTTSIPDHDFYDEYH